MGNMFKDHVAIVTGGGSGLGEGLCQVLARRKTHVVVADVDQESAEATAMAVAERGGSAEAVLLDVRNEADVVACVEGVYERHGRLDYMFNNAGIMVAAEVQDSTREDWQQVLDVNLWGTVFGSKAAYDVMRRQGSGYIINTASVPGLIGAPGMSAYAATESATIGYTLSLRDEAALHGIKASVICPGYIESNLFSDAKFKNAEREAVLKKIPFKGVKPEKAAESVIEGLRKNQPMIIFPLHARVLWWLSRINPSLVAPLTRKSARDYHQAKQAAVESA